MILDFKKVRKGTRILNVCHDKPMRVCENGILFDLVTSLVFDTKIFCAGLDCY